MPPLSPRERTNLLRQAATERNRLAREQIEASRRGDRQAVERLQRSQRQAEEDLNFRLTGTPSYTPRGQDRPDIMPERWTLEGPQLAPAFVARFIRQHTSARDVRVAWTFYGDISDSANYENQWGGQPDRAHIIGARLNRSSLLSQLDAGYSLRQILTQYKGYGAGEVEAVTRFSFGPAAGEG